MKICYKLDVNPRSSIPDVILIKNEGLMVQTCRNINVHVPS